MDAVTALTGSAGPASATDRASMTREQFLEILIAELTSQNPLDPLNNADFMQQIVGLQSLEQTAQLTDSLATFQNFIEMSSGSSLIGRSVKGLTPDGRVVEGVVDRVVMEGNQVNLVVGSDIVPLGAVHEVSAAEQAAGVTV